jgi:hypothetical protein
VVGVMAVFIGVLETGEMAHNRKHRVKGRTALNYW